MTCGSCQGMAELKAKVAMCHTCRVQQRCPVYHVATVKMGTFAPVGACPRGRWPDEAGVVVWLRMRWMGVPMPLRVRIGVDRAWAAFRQATGPGYLSGCGCSVRLKGLWWRLAFWKRYNVAKATSEVPHAVTDGL